MRISWWTKPLNCKMHCLQFAHQLVRMCGAHETKMAAGCENDEFISELLC
jgi:hypothetical protein